MSSSVAEETGANHACHSASPGEDNKTRGRRYKNVKDYNNQHNDTTATIMGRGPTTTH